MVRNVENMRSCTREYNAIVAARAWGVCETAKLSFSKHSPQLETRNTDGPPGPGPGKAGPGAELIHLGGFWSSITLMREHSKWVNAQRQHLRLG